MKKMIFYCTLFFGGIIGFTGWMLVCATKVRVESWSNALTYMEIPDYLIAALFVLCAVTGLVLAAKEARSTDK